MALLFVCGTDTQIGKTTITAALGAFLKSKKINAVAVKPYESGCDWDSKKKQFIRADTHFLKKIMKIKEAEDDLNYIAYREALAPGVCHLLGGPTVSFSEIDKNLAELEKKYSLVLVEGAGGLFSPLTATKTNLDLIRYLDAPVLIVARAGLGTLNHTRMTYEILRRNGVKCLGVVLNSTSKHKDISEKTNPEILENWGIPVLGIFPFMKKLTKKKLISALSSQRKLGSRVYKLCLKLVSNP